MFLEVKSIWRKQLGGTTKLQRFSRPCIQFPSYRVELFLREPAQVSALGQVLAQQAISVLVDPPLPGTVGISEVDLYARGFSQLLVRGHFPPLIVSQRKTLLRINAIEHKAESAQSRFCTTISGIRPRLSSPRARGRRLA
jgi:hypothetical protein